MLGLIRLGIGLLWAGLIVLFLGGTEGGTEGGRGGEGKMKSLAT